MTAAHGTGTHRMVSWISQRLFRDNVYTVRHGLLRGLRRKGGLGFLPAWLTRAEDADPEVLFLSELRPAGVVYDVGAFEGIMTLHFARYAAIVYAYEPNPDNRARLEANLRVNSVGQVVVRPLGVGGTVGTGTIVWDPLLRGQASLDPALQIRTGETGASTRSSRVGLTTLDAEVFERDQNPPDLIKIDIEGMELDALRGGEQVLRTHHPDLYVELHGATAEEKAANAEAIRELLMRAGYPSAFHVESRRVYQSSEAGWPGSGHLYLSIRRDCSS